MPGRPRLIPWRPIPPQSPTSTSSWSAPGRPAPPPRRVAPGAPATYSSSTRRRFPGTSAAATGSPRSVCGSSSTSVSVPTPSPTSSPSTARCSALPSGRTVNLPLPTGSGMFAAVAPRKQLDAALLDIAAESGADVRTGHAVKSATVGDGGGARLGIEGLGDIAASHVVVADGMWSPTRKALGLAAAGYLGEWHAFRQYVGSVTGPASRQLDRVVRCRPLARLRAGRSRCPADGPTSVSACCAAAARSGKDAKQLWAGLLERPHIADALGAALPRRSATSPGRSPPASTRPRSATARALRRRRGGGDRCDDRRGNRTSPADRSPCRGGDPRRGTIGSPPLRATVRSGARRRPSDVGTPRPPARAPPGRDGALAIVAHSGRWGRRNFARWMFEDEPRAILATPRRWHRQFFKRPGAYA